MNYREFTNDTISDQVKSLLASSNARVRACVTNYFITTANALASNDSSFAVYWPIEETTTLTYVPQQDLIDYIVYVCSSIGIWFGLSLYSAVNYILQRFRTRTTHDQVQVNTINKLGE